MKKRLPNFRLFMTTFRIILFAVFMVSAHCATASALDVHLSANVTSGEAPLEVEFDVTVSGYSGRYSGKWDFDGDGVMDSYSYGDQDQTYYVEGEYEACVWINNNGIIESACVHISVERSANCGNYTVDWPEECDYYGDACRINRVWGSIDCDVDCTWKYDGLCKVASKCGNGVCDITFNEEITCVEDCQGCGDGTCDEAGDENQYNCPADCPIQQHSIYDMNVSEYLEDFMDDYKDEIDGLDRPSGEPGELFGGIPF